MKLKLYTTAPPDYDGFSTRRVCLAGHMDGKQVWEVELSARDLAWQSARYTSGCHMAFDPRLWGQVVLSGMATLAEGDPPCSS